jgi:hypothetical protein
MEFGNGPFRALNHSAGSQNSTERKRNEKDTESNEGQETGSGKEAQYHKASDDPTLKRDAFWRKRETLWL